MIEKHPVARELAAQGIRKDWFAQQAGVSPSMLSHILAFRRRGSDEFYDRASLLLRRPVADLRPPAAPPAAQDARVAA